MFVETEGGDATAWNLKGETTSKGATNSLSLETPKIDSSFTFVRSRRMIFFFLSFFRGRVDYDLRKKRKKKKKKEKKEKKTNADNRKRRGIKRRINGTGSKEEKIRKVIGRRKRNRSFLYFSPGHV